MSPIDIVLIVAGVGYVLARRVLGELLEVKGLLVVPVVLTVIGLCSLDDVAPVDATTLTFVALGIALSIVLGLIRGTTVQLGERNGELWMRYRANTVLLWVVNIAIKAAMVPVEQSISPQSAAAADHTILLSIGLGILAETAVVIVRAMRSKSVVVWAKGEDGAPHRTSPAFDSVRSWVNSATAAEGRRMFRQWRDARTGTW